jgi:para-nitrobenzyl esterase
MIGPFARAAALALTCATLSFCAAPGIPDAPPTVVAIDAGKLQGALDNGVVAFAGIPFAAPPVGDLRWRPPQKAASWQGLRPATDFGNDCLQGVVPGDPGVGTKLGEDCLYLNVWRPVQPSPKRLPVMVWIYGGGLVNGGTQPAIYSGDEFARQGLVFVSLNYRLGRFGFFAFPALTREHPDELKGNYGYMDQIAALQWVQKNIAAFGGDPGNVTVFGESAGGYSVNTLLITPLAKGLFHKAIIESGGGRDQLSGGRPISIDAPGRPSAESTGVEFAKKLGVMGSDAAALAQLRALPADKITDNLSMRTFLNLNPQTYAGPVVDGRLVIEAPEAIYRTGKQARVPVMVGANSSDLGLNSATSVDAALAGFGDKAAALKAYDPEGKGDVGSVRSKVGMDQLMVEPARFVAQEFAAHGLAAYEYRFDYVADALRTERTSGAPHASEIPYVFGKMNAGYLAMVSPKKAGEASAKDTATSKTMQSYWVNFAKTGDPNGAGLPRWPKYDAAGDQIMIFRGDGVSAAQVDPWRARLDLTAGMHK